VFTWCYRGYCVRRGCDIQCVAGGYCSRRVMYRALKGDNVLGEDILYRVLQVYCGRRGCDI
jgi:hypothetical protein